MPIERVERVHGFKIGPWYWKLKSRLQQHSSSPTDGYSRRELYNAACREASKHSNESCSNCGKHILFDEWICYYSLCPDCYLRLPKEELDKIDRALNKLSARLRLGENYPLDATDDD